MSGLLCDRLGDMVRLHGVIVECLFRLRIAKHMIIKIDKRMRKGSLSSFLHIKINSYPNKYDPFHLSFTFTDSLEPRLNSTINLYQISIFSYHTHKLQFNLSLYSPTTAISFLSAFLPFTVLKS